MSIFTEEDRSIFAHENGWNMIFDAFEILIREDEHILIEMNDPNVNVLIEASKKTGAERRCILLLHALCHVCTL